MTDNQNVEVWSDDVRQRPGHDLIHRHAVKSVQNSLGLFGSLHLGSLPLIYRLLRLVALCRSASLLLRGCHVYLKKTAERMSPLTQTKRFILIFITSRWRTSKVSDSLRRGWRLFTPGGGAAGGGSGWTLPATGWGSCSWAGWWCWRDASMTGFW